jgi:poly(3-hydroxybutyrate) depolymerase
MPEKSAHPSEFLLTSIPVLWPMAMAASLMEEGVELYARNLKFVEEEIKIHHELPRI